MVLHFSVASHRSRICAKLFWDGKSPYPILKKDFFYSSKIERLRPYGYNAFVAYNKKTPYTFSVLVGRLVSNTLVSSWAHHITIFMYNTAKQFLKFIVYFSILESVCIPKIKMISVKVYIYPVLIYPCILESVCIPKIKMISVKVSIYRYNR